MKLFFRLPSAVALLALALAAQGCIIIPQPKPFSVGVAAKELGEIGLEKTIAAPASDRVALSEGFVSGRTVAASALATVETSPDAEGPAAEPERTDIRGAGDGSMKIERVTVTAHAKDIPHRAPNFSAEQAAAMMCASRKMGLSGNSARRMHEATVRAKDAREALAAGKISLKQADDAELRRQDAVLNYMLPVPILNLLITPVEKKQDMPKPVYGTGVLEDTDLFTFKENGKEVIAVSGIARNTGMDRVELPPLTLRALDEWDFSIAGQSSLLPFESLGPGEARPFEIRFLNPPEYTTEVYVHFAPPFMYRSPRDCEFFNPATFDPSAPLDAPATAANLAPMPQVGEGAPVYSASELNQLTLFYRRESEAAWRCQTRAEAMCSGADGSQRLHWRDMFAMAEAIDEAWVAMRAAEEARRRLAARAGTQSEANEAELARQSAIHRFMALGRRALARAGASAPDVAVDVATAEFGRDQDGLHVEIAGKVRNTGAAPRRVDALMVAFVDRLELPLSSVAVDFGVTLAPGAEQAFTQRLQATASRGAGGSAARMTPGERRHVVAPARIPPRDVPWQVRVGAMARQ